MQVHNGAMHSIRLRIAHGGPSLQLVIPIFDPRLLRSQELIIIDWLSLPPDALRSTKIGDAAVGGDARASKDQEIRSPEECPLDRPSVSFQINRFAFTPIWNSMLRQWRCSAMALVPSATQADSQGLIWSN